MTHPTPSLFALLAAFLALAATSSDAFLQPSVVRHQAPNQQQVVTPSAFITASLESQTLTILRAEGEGSASQGGEEEAVAEEESGDDEEVEEEATEPEPKTEDPELTAIKQEIVNLESSLKAKKSEIQYLQDAADLNSKAGYARKVAEMENMRRARSSMASSNKETSIANVLRDFMVVKDKLDALKDQYETHPFGKQYTALAGNLNSAFSAMGVSEYTANAGEKIDPTRVLVVDEVYSTDFDKGTVVELLKPGLELKGNIIRLAECVGSLGEEGADGPSEEESENTEEEAEDL